jgi:hypothetical protein
MSTKQTTEPATILTHEDFVARLEAMRGELEVIGMGAPRLNGYPGYFSLSVALRSLDELATHHRVAAQKGRLHAQG